MEKEKVEKRDCGMGAAENWGGEKEGNY